MPTSLPARKKRTSDIEWDSGAIAIGAFMALVLSFSILAIHEHLTSPPLAQSPEDLIVLAGF